MSIRIKSTDRAARAPTTFCLPPAAAAAAHPSQQFVSRAHVDRRLHGANGHEHNARNPHAVRVRVQPFNRTTVQPGEQNERRQFVYCRAKLILWHVSRSDNTDQRAHNMRPIHTSALAPRNTPRTLHHVRGDAERCTRTFAGLDRRFATIMMYLVVVWHV